ncbi:MAG: hypothetical protein M1821_001180 [Bathelium mastoideum]|nr:MAG: hypothetical protein M1821_001180 [Bathelium mastoideum]KAI9686863.1 MAG: hypothetical protein M1822_002616 [Bathelium mastoideum]
MADPPPSGIYVPVPTFFARKTAANYNPIAPPVDIQTQVAHSLYLARSGIRGLVLLGSTGEAIHLTNAERNAVISGVRKGFDEAGFKDYPLIAGTAAQNIEEVVGQLNDAKDAGAQWGLCLAPGYFASAVSQEGLEGWFKAVADASPIPIMIYHYPGVSNSVPLLPSTIAKLSSHPNIVGCKLSHGALDDHTLLASSPTIDHTHFHVFTGLGQQLLPVLTVGGAGAIDGLAAIFPRTVVELYDTFHHTIGHKASSKNSLAVVQRNLEDMRKLQYHISAGEKLIAKWGTVGIKEACARILEFGDADGARLPLQGGFPEGDKEWEKWAGVLGELKKLEKEHGGALEGANGSA